MGKSREKPVAAGPDRSNLAALAKLQAISHELMARQQHEEIAALKAQTLLYETALNQISEGLCVFTGFQKIIFCNARYAEIYRLKPDEISPGTALPDLMAQRAAAGTAPVAADDGSASHALLNTEAQPKSWTATLGDGRSVRISRQPLPEAGWLEIHEEVAQVPPDRHRTHDGISVQTLIDWVPDYLWVKDAASRFVLANKALAYDNVLATPGDLVGLSDNDIHPTERGNNFHVEEQAIMRSGVPMVDKEECVIGLGGEEKWLRSTKVPLYDENNECFGLIGIARDITERRKAELLSNGQAQVLEMIAINAPLEAILERLIRLVEDQLAGIFGSVLLLDREGLHLKHGAAPSLPKAFTDAIDGTAIGPKVGSCGTAAYRRERVIVTDIRSDPLWEDFRDLAAPYGYRSCWSTPVMSPKGAVLGVFAMYSTEARQPTPRESHLIDVTIRIAGIAIERRRAEEQIKLLAHHDPLTGLLNRSLLNDRLQQAILQTRRHKPSLSVVFIDLDNFKTINDSLGHSAGDRLLKAVAKRMEASVRATDTIVRLGGDEFVIILIDQPGSPVAPLTVVERIRAAVAEPLAIDGHSLDVTCSLGVATYPNDGEDPETLLMNADAAMYKAKEAGRDNVQFYAAEMNTKVRERLTLQHEMREGIKRQEFLLHYQPQVDLDTGQVFAVEALVRWNHPTHAMMPPVSFIPLAEETGLIVSLGDWVLREACRQNKAWQDMGLPPVSVSVNVSARQFRDKTYVSRVSDALSESGMAGKFLELEITESLIMNDVEEAVAKMQSLQELGVRLAIDDFGMGYSSLNALKTFPVARLKIDRAFIQNLTKDKNDRAVVGAVISLGQKLNLRVIAEGVETAEQVLYLRKNKCHEIQGYYFSKPVAPEAITSLITSQKVNAA